MESSPQRGSDGAVPVAPRSSDLLTSQRQEQTAEVDVHESLLVEAPRRAQVLLRYSKTHFKSHLLWMAFILRRHSVTRHRLYTEDNKCKWSNNYPDSTTHAEELMESGEQTNSSIRQMSEKQEYTRLHFWERNGESAVRALLYTNLRFLTWQQSYICHTWYITHTRLYHFTSLWAAVELLIKVVYSSRPQPPAHGPVRESIGTGRFYR